MGVIRQALFAPRDRALLLAALVSPATHAITLTLSEKAIAWPPTDRWIYPIPTIAADLAVAAGAALGHRLAGAGAGQTDGRTARDR